MNSRNFLRGALGALIGLIFAVCIILGIRFTLRWTLLDHWIFTGALNGLLGYWMARMGASFALKLGKQRS